MRIAVIFVFLFIASIGVSDVFGQIEQGRRQRQRMDASIKASEDLEHDRRLETEAALPVPKAAVMNVDVQAVLAKADYKTFAEAKLAEVKKVVDGEPLWLYLKFKSKLGDYVLTTRHPDDREKLRYTLYAEIAPRGDITALSQYAIQFTKEDLPATEVKINLAPGLFGRNKSIPVFLMTSGTAKTGVWNNEFRLTNTNAFPRALTQNLVSVPITLDFSGGLSKYPKMDSEYDSIILRGSTDLTKLPIAGTFFSDALREQVAARLATENIQPIKIYFSGDDWQEFASFGGNIKKIKRVFATFTYRRGEECFYGVAEMVENFDFLQSKFVRGEASLKKDLAVPCGSELNLVVTDPVYFFHKCKIDIGDSRPVVRRGPKLGVSPSESDIGMMVRGFGDLPDLVDEREAFGEVSELKSLNQTVLIHPPTGRRSDHRFQLFIR